MKNSILKSFCICLLLITLFVSVEAVFASQKININKASAVELVALKGVGDKTAESIVEYRNVHGEFKTINALVNVKGVGEKTLAKLSDQITVTDEVAQK